jgi:hypothetical protein
MALSSKDPVEKIDITFDFSNQYLTVTDPVVTVSNHGSMTDITSMKGSPATVVNNNKVVIRIQNGENNKKYDLRCSVTTNTGEVVVAKDILTVKTL